MHGVSSGLVISDKGKQVVNVDIIKELKAMALAMDFEPVHPLLLEASLRSNSDVQLCPMNSKVLSQPASACRIYNIQYSDRFIVY